MTRVFGSARIDEKKKKQAEELFASFGMSLSTSVNLFINEALTGHPVRDPSAGGETLTAMAEARQLAADPGAKRYDDIDELFNDALK